MATVKTTKQQKKPSGDKSTDYKDLKDKYGLSHQAVTGAVRATRITNREVLEDYLTKKRGLKTRSRRFVQSVR